jgi:hypothetical protein
MEDSDVKAPPRCALLFGLPGMGVFADFPSGGDPSAAPGAGRQGAHPAEHFEKTW